MRLVWRQTALDSRDNIMRRISQDNPAAAIELDHIFELKAAHAQQHPALYRMGIVEGTREIVVTRNYLIIYAIRDEFVEILHVIHTRQDRARNS